jgi:hypothetical protein
MREALSILAYRLGYWLLCVVDWLIEVSVRLGG